jgi:hypothetical protein
MLNEKKKDLKNCTHTMINGLNKFFKILFLKVKN